MMTIVPRNALRQATGIARHDHNPARSTYREEKTVQTMGSTAECCTSQRYARIGRSSFQQVF